MTMIEDALTQAAYFAFRSYLALVKNKPDKGYSDTITAGNPCDSSTIIITTADQEINKQMRDALTDFGFNPGIMNDDIIPMGLVNMGLERGKDHFAFVMRANIFQDPDIGWDHIYNLDKYFTVLRITPEKPYTTVNPWPIPALKRKGTSDPFYKKEESPFRLLK